MPHASRTGQKELRYRQGPGLFDPRLFGTCNRVAQTCAGAYTVDMAKKSSRRSSGARSSGRRQTSSSRTPAKAEKNPATLAARLRAAAGPITFREVGMRTGTHPENARRYLQGGSVGLKFFKNFCKVFDVSADWLLEGIGPRERSARKR